MWFGVAGVYRRWTWGRWAARLSTRLISAGDCALGRAPVALTALAVLATLSLAVTLETVALLAMAAETETAVMSSFAWSFVRFLTSRGLRDVRAVARRFQGR